MTLNQVSSHPSATRHLAVAQSGDPAEFGRLLEPYRRELLAYCYRFLGSPLDAEDLVQETMLRAWRRRDTFNQPVSFRAWLYKIASNTFLSDRRKRSREDPLMDGAEEFLPAATVDSVSQLDARDLLAEVESYVLGLPPKQRIALILRKYHELGYDEIAANLNSTEAAARANVHEALRKLRDCFGDRL
jgi:RNA polymerase sigma-70 factor (ECF subfamily)